MAPAPETKNNKPEESKTDQKNVKSDLGLEEDDEFEEFPEEDWTKNEEDQTVWDDNWENENVESDFSTLLKEELQKRNITPAF